MLCYSNDGPGKRWPNSILQGSLDAVSSKERPQLLKALRTVMNSEDGRICNAASKMYRFLSPKELAALMPDIEKSIRVPAPSGEMFAYGIRMEGLELLARLNIREGMDLCVDILNEKRWGRDFERAARTLKKYEGSAKAVLPRLKNETREMIKGEGKERPQKLEKLIKEIESFQGEKELLTIKEYVTEHG